MGRAPHPLRAVHRPAAVLQGHGTGWHLDGQAGSVPGQRRPGGFFGFRGGFDQETRGFREEFGGSGGEDQGFGRVRHQVDQRGALCCWWCGPKEIHGELYLLLLLDLNCGTLCFGGCDAK